MSPQRNRRRLPPGHGHTKTGEPAGPAGDVKPGYDLETPQDWDLTELGLPGVRQRFSLREFFINSQPIEAGSVKIFYDQSDNKVKIFDQGREREERTTLQFLLNIGIHAIENETGRDALILIDEISEALAGRESRREGGRI